MATVWRVPSGALSLVLAIVATALWHAPAVTTSLEQPATPDRLTRPLSYSPNRPLVVEVTIGEIEVEGWDRSDVSIDLRRAGSGTSALPLVVDESGPVLRVSAVQADGATDPAMRATLTARVPASARVESIHLVEGRLRLVNLAGGVTATVDRGPIEGSALAGAIRLESGIGSIVLRHARLTEGGLIRLRVFNGDVTLELAGRPSSARILALALNGAIESDIPLTHKDRVGPRFAETTIGAGEPVISIDVVTGHIRIRTAG